MQNTFLQKDVEHNIYYYIKCKFFCLIRLDNSLYQTMKPVAEVLKYLHAQVSAISCRDIGSTPTMSGKTLTQQL